MLPEELRQAKAQGEGGGKDQPGIGHQAVVVEGRFGCGRGGYVVASIGCSFSGTGFLFQNHYPRFRGAPFCSFTAGLLHAVLRWIRV